MRTASVALGVGVFAVAISCLVSSYSLVSQTFDEPHHVAAGLEWWQRGTYSLWTETPPLGRASISLLPYLTGSRLPEAASGPLPKGRDVWILGNDVLYADGQHERRLTLARLGVLPWLALAAFMTWYIPTAAGYRYAGWIAAAMLISLPAVLAHGGLATTDIPLAAACLVVIQALLAFFDRRTVGTALIAGLACGAAIATKFSAILFLGITAIVLAAPVGEGGRHSPARRHKLARALAWAVGMAAVVWCSYRFSVGSLGELPNLAFQMQNPITRLVSTVRVPAPELLHGLLFLAAHVREGEPSYLLGQTSAHGFPAFYLVALAVKTPFPFLVLLLLGALGLAVKGSATARLPLALSATAGLIVASVVPSSINLGIRHLLIVYPLLAMSGACGFEHLVRSRWLPKSMGTWLAAGVVLWQTAIMVMERPNYIAYFNRLAGDEPGWVLGDSDFDWGQDLGALARFSREHHIDELHIAYFGTARPCDAALPLLRALEPGRRTRGWVAISDTYYRGRTLRGLRLDPCDDSTIVPASASSPGAFAWLQAHRPTAWAGKTIRVYRIP